MHQRICQLEDIAINTGVAALFNEKQVAIFKVKTEYGTQSSEQVFAISNYDPFSGANVLSRGIVGSLGGELVVASPIYKQHFYLSSGICVEENSIQLETWQVKVEDNAVFLLNDKVAAA